RRPHRVDGALQFPLRVIVVDRLAQRREGSPDLAADLTGGFLELALRPRDGRVAGSARFPVVIGETTTPRREPLPDVVPCLLRVLRRVVRHRSHLPRSTCPQPTSLSLLWDRSQRPSRRGCLDRTHPIVATRHRTKEHRDGRTRITC